MAVKEEAALPFIDNFPVRVQIRIYSDGSGYTADINADSWYRLHIGLKPQEVEELNSELQQAVEQVSKFIGTEDVCSSALEELAQKGNYAFKRVFSDDVLREMIKKVLETGATIQFSSEDFFIPWELLYDGPLGKQMDISCFWGMRHIVSRNLLRKLRRGDFVSPLIKSVCPHVGLITYNELEHVIGKEIPALQELQRQNRLLLIPLRPLNANLRDEELEYLSHFLREEELQIIHVACHAREKKPSSQSYLLVSDEFSISIEDFFVREIEIKYNPFVILNACLTGTISPLYTSNWAALFCEHGARGVLATEFHVPDWFAAAFTEELYKHFLSGKPIGEALLATRHHFWEQQSNPLGLAYALYSSPSIRIANSN